MDTQLLPFRLKSARRKKHLQIEDRDKQLLKLDRERDRINKDPDYKTTVPLDEPYQKGWKRLFVLKRDVARSDKAGFYQGILDEINSVQYHYDESFRNSKRIRRWNRYYHKELPKLHRISPHYWQISKRKLSEEQRAFFRMVKFWNQQYYRWEYSYEFTMPELFEIAVRPHIIDTIKVGDALLEQRLSWIEDYFDSNYLHCRLDKLKNGNRYKGWKEGTEKQKYANPLKNKAKCNWLDE